MAFWFVRVKFAFGLCFRVDPLVTMALFLMNSSGGRRKFSGSSSFFHLLDPGFLVSGHEPWIKLYMVFNSFLFLKFIYIYVLFTGLQCSL